MRAGILLPGLAIAAAGSALIGLRIGIPWLLPLLNAAPAHAMMILCLRQGRRGAAILFMLWWAACLGGVMTILCAIDPWRTATPTVVHGAAYFAEMRSWVATGIGCESDPSCFIPQHLLHAGVFVALALVTASAAAIVMGAVLMNYMAFYVGSLASYSVSPALVAVIGWAPWSLVRIASFVILGVVLAEPLLSRITGRPAPPGRVAWVLLACGGLLADIVLKWLLAPAWAPMIRLAVHG